MTRFVKFPFRFPMTGEALAGGVERKHQPQGLALGGHLADHLFPRKGRVCELLQYAPLEGVRGVQRVTGSQRSLFKPHPRYLRKAAGHSQPEYRRNKSLEADDLAVDFGLGLSHHLLATASRTVSIPFARRGSRPD